VFSLPLMGPDGWQVALHLEPLTPKQWLVSDRGKTLGAALDNGLKPNSKRAQQILAELSSFYEFEFEGLVAQKVVAFPIKPSEIQIFAEGLVAIGHRFPQKISATSSSPGRQVEESVSSFFYQRKLMPIRNHVLAGKIESEIRVEYFLDQATPMALQPITRGKDMLPYMEQWGFRWNDLHDAHPEIRRVMVFDPDNQEWDARSLRIGESVCDLFVPYSETDAVAELIA